jgi:nucleoside-diphosphate-sugar epimerase
MTASDRSTAFVTGATGFLGRRLIAALLQRDREVVALVRDPLTTDGLSHPRLRLLQGDVLTLQSRDVPAGATLFHLAALRQIPGTPLDDLTRVNRDGSAAVARAAVGAGVRRLIHISTAMIFGPSDGVPADEERAFSEHARQQPFLASRIAALEAVDQIAGESTDTVTLFPTIIYGPDHPSHPNIVTSHLRHLTRSRIVPGFPGWSRRRNLVHVDDVVEGILAAEQKAPAGSRLILGGEDVTPEELQEIVFALADRRAWRVPFPRVLALSAARGADLLLRRRGSFDYTMRIRILQSEWSFSSARAISTIDYRWRDVRSGVEETLGLTGTGAGGQ